MSILDTIGEPLTLHSFETLLSPYDGDFTDRVMGQLALYIAGFPAKFADLFSWLELNRLLEFGGLASPRLRIISQGLEMSPDLYLGVGASGYPRPRPPKIYSALRSGGVLVIQSVEELCERISRLCQMCELKLQVPVMADLYANCASSDAGGLRWNDQELLLLQLDGSRAWRLYPPTGLSPVPPNSPPEPTGEPAWEGVLTAGDLLYLPRGWWYADRWVNSALYLAMKFRNPTGLDVLHRVVHQMVSHEDIRADCPRFGNLERHSAFLRVLQSEVLEQCARPGLILAFLKECADTAEPRVRFNLPWSAAPIPLPPSEDLVALPLLRFPHSESIIHSRSDDAVEVLLDGKVVRLPEEVADIFQLVCEAPRPTVRSLREVCSQIMSEDKFVSSLSDLITCGMVAFE